MERVCKNFIRGVFFLRETAEVRVGGLLNGTVISCIVGGINACQCIFGTKRKIRKMWDLQYFVL